MARRDYSALWSDPRVKPPYGSVEINRGHPIGANAVGCWLINESGSLFTDLTRQTGSFLMAGPDSSIVVGQSGFVYRVTAAGTTNNAKHQGGTTPFYGAFTFATRFRRFTTGGGGLFSIASHHTTDGVASDWLLYLSVNTLTVDIPWVVASVVSGGIISDTTTEHSVALTRSGGTGSWTWTLYLDGAQSGQTVGSASNPNTSGDDFYFQSRVDGTSDSGRVDMANALLCNRALTAGEILSLHQAPYIVCRPVIRRRYFVPSAEAAAASAVRRRLTLLGVGS